MMRVPAVGAHKDNRVAKQRRKKRKEEGSDKTCEEKENMVLSPTQKVNLCI
jgi:hypothetical protein